MPTTYNCCTCYSFLPAILRLVVRLDTSTTADTDLYTGINAFVYYAPIFFAALGQSYEMSLILSGMVNICQFVAGIPTFLFLDKMGRRKLAIFGGIAMGIPHIIMAGIVSKYNDSWESSPGIGWFGVALICKYWLFPTQCAHC